MLKEKITKQKKISIDENDITCCRYENIYTSLIAIQNHILELFSKDEIKLILEPFVFNQFREIGIAILGIINYGLYYLEKVAYYERLLQHYDYKIKSENVSKKERYFFEKKADESEYYFYLAKAAVKNASNQINAIVPDVELLSENIINYITNDKYNSENLTNISILIKDNNKRILDVFIEKLVGKNMSVNDILTELDLNLKAGARLSYHSKPIDYIVNGDFEDRLKLNRVLITFVFLPIILSSKLMFSKQKYLKKSFKALLKLLNKLCKRSDLDANNLFNNLFGLLIIYFVSDKTKQDINLKKDEVRFDNLSDNIIIDFCIENLKIINLKAQDSFDKRIYKKFSCIYKYQLEKH